MTMPKTRRGFTQPAPKPLPQPLTEKQKQMLFAALLRDESLFRAASSRIDEMVFAPRNNKLFGVIWATASAFYLQHQQLPDFDTLMADMESVLQDARWDDVDDEDMKIIGQTVTLAESLTPEQIKERKATINRYLQQLLTETFTREMRGKFSDSHMLDIRPILQDMQTKVERISSIVSEGLKEPFPLDFRKLATTPKVPTGCAFLDCYMDGQADGEVYGLCAPFGVCKTTLGVQLSCERISWTQAQLNMAQQRASQAGRIFEGKLPRVYLVVYEEEEADLHPRFLAYEARVNKNVLEAGDWANLSSKEKRNYKPYERQIFKSKFEEGIEVDGEVERIQAATRKLNRNLRIINFLEDKNLRGQAGDGAEGIAEVIRADQEMYDNPGVSLVIVDYVGAAADRQCMKYNLKPSDNMRHIIGRFPMRLKTEIASPFKCPVWAFHQLSTEANKRSSGVVPKMTDAAEAKNFFEHVTFGFMIGMKTKEHLAVITNSKQRRAAAQADRVIFIDGAYSRVLDTNGEYRIDNSRIVSSDVADQIAEIPEEDPTEARASRSGLYVGSRRAGS